MKHQNLLIVDDEVQMRQEIKTVLSSHFTLYEASDSNRAIQLVEEKEIDIVLLDIWLGDEVNGIETLGKIQRLDRDIEVIMISSDDSLDLINQCVDRGVYTYIKKPIQKDELLIATHISKKIRQKIYECRINEDLHRMHEISPEELVGKSKTIEGANRAIMQLGKYHTITILIRGESGTGKELVARALHKEYGNNNRPFVAVNCGALSPSLMESELFGHEKGSFTGADRRKLGIFELGNGGDIFLDEIAELPIDCQAKLLRVLDGSGFMRVGGSRLLFSDFRLILATNKNLEEMVLVEKFREDLYHRINAHTIYLPPLRERIEDIGMLCEYLLQKICKRLRISPKQCSEKVIAYFEKLSWKGNVRELRNMLENMAVNASSNILEAHDLQSLEVDSLVTQRSQDTRTQTLAQQSGIGLSLYKASQAEGLSHALDHFEKEALSFAIQSHDQLTQVAKTMKMSRTTLFLKMKKYNLMS